MAAAGKARRGRARVGGVVVGIKRRGEGAGGGTHAMCLCVLLFCTEEEDKGRWAGLQGEVDEPAGPLWPGCPFFSSEKTRIFPIPKKEKRKEEIGGKIN